jgi:hypothetical protein
MMTKSADKFASTDGTSESITLLSLFFNRTVEAVSLAPLKRQFSQVPVILKDSRTTVRSGRPTEAEKGFDYIRIGVLLPRQVQENIYRQFSPFFVLCAL